MYEKHNTIDNTIESVDIDMKEGEKSILNDHDNMAVWFLEPETMLNSELNHIDDVVQSLGMEMSNMYDNYNITDDNMVLQYTDIKEGDIITEYGEKRYGETLYNLENPIYLMDIMLKNNNMIDQFTNDDNMAILLDQFADDDNMAIPLDQCADDDNMAVLLLYDMETETKPTLIEGENITPFGENQYILENSDRMRKYNRDRYGDSDNMAVPFSEPETILPSNHDHNADVIQSLGLETSNMYEKHNTIDNMIESVDIDMKEGDLNHIDDVVQSGNMVIENITKYGNSAPNLDNNGGSPNTVTKYGENGTEYGENSTVIENKFDIEPKTTENDTVLLYITALSIQYAELKSENTDILKENVEMKTELRTMKEYFAALSIQYAELKSENMAIMKENAETKTEFRTMKDQLLELQQEYRDIMRDNDNMVDRFAANPL